MRLLRLVTLRSMFKRKSRSILTLFGIIIGVAAIFSINHVNEKAFLSLTEFFEGTSGKVQLEISSASLGESFQEEMLTAVRETEGVKTAVAILETTALIRSEEEEEEPLSIGFSGLGQEGFTLHAIHPSEDREMRDYILKEGELFKAEDEAKILLVYDYAVEKGIETGDSIRIQMEHGVEEMLVLGLLEKEGAGMTNLGKFGIIPLAYGQKIQQQEERITRIDVISTVPVGDTEGLENLKEKLQAELGEGVEVNYPGREGQETSQMLGGYQISLNFMAGIALFVGAFLIYNALSMTVAERKKEIGVLRCVGMTRGQMTGQILFEGLLLGLLGSVFGVLLGILLSDGLSGIMENILGSPIEKGGYDPGLILLSISVGLLVTLLSAVLPAIQAGKVSPLEALRKNDGKKKGRRRSLLWIPGLVLLAASIGILVWNPFPYDVQFRLGSMTVFMLFLGATLLIPVTLSLWQFLVKWPFKMLFGGIGDIGIRNIERSRNRTMLTVAALMVGVSMIVATQGITGSFKADLMEWMDAYLGGDIFINSSIPVTLDVREEMEAISGVETVSPAATHPVIWLNDGEEEDMTFIGIDPQAYSKVTKFVFTEEDIEEETVLEQMKEGGFLLISEVISSKYDIQAGDEISLKTQEGVRKFRVAAVVLDFSSQGLVVTGNLSDMETFFGVREGNSFSLKTVEGYDVAEVAMQMKETFREDYDFLIESNVTLKEQTERLMSQAFGMFDVLGVLSVMVAALGVLNTLTMSVMERTREIGMLRTMGMTRFQIVKMIESEAGLLGIIGGALGLLLGILLTWILLQAMGAMSGYQLEFMMPVKAIWMSILVSLVTAFLAALFPAVKASRTPMLSAIHYE